MGKKKPVDRGGSPAAPQIDLQRPAAEILYADELRKLIEAEGDAPRPQGWQLSPQAVLKFVLGDDQLNIKAKFVGSRSFLERSMGSGGRACNAVGDGESSRSG